MSRQLPDRTKNRESVAEAFAALAAHGDDAARSAYERLRPLVERVPNSLWVMFVNPDSGEGRAVRAALDVESVEDES